MTALAAPRTITQYDDTAVPRFMRAIKVAANGKIYHGGLVALNATGYAVAATATGSQRAVGVADLEAWNDQQNTGQAMPVTLQTPFYVVDNTGGADGARSVAIRIGCFVFNNKGGDLVDQSLMGKAVYIEDDNTVRKTSTGSSQAGILVGFNDAGLPIVFVAPALT